MIMLNTLSKGWILIMPGSALACRYFSRDERSPWHLVPADQNGHIAYVMACTLCDRLLKMSPQYSVASLSMP
jgi:hypothetical protein